MALIWVSLTKVYVPVTSLSLEKLTLEAFGCWKEKDGNEHMGSISIYCKKKIQQALHQCILMENGTAKP